MHFIDFHTHIYPDAIASKAADNVRQFYDGLGNPVIDGKAQTLLERGTAAGVQEFVVLPVAVQAARTRHINDFILDQVAKEPRFYGYGTIHAAMEDLTGEVQYIMDHGLRGIKMHPDYQLFAIDDPRLFPVYEMAGEKLPFIFHMGDRRYGLRYLFSLCVVSWSAKVYGLHRCRVAGGDGFHEESSAEAECSIDAM